MALNYRFAFDDLRSLAFGGIGAAYAAIGARTDVVGRLFMVQNLTDQTLMFSLDGTTDHFPLPANGFLLIDLDANKTIQGGKLELMAGATFYVRHIGVAPTIGTVYVSLGFGR